MPVFHVIEGLVQEATLDIYADNFRATFFDRGRISEAGAGGGNTATVSQLNIPFNRRSFSIDFIDFKQTVHMAVGDAALVDYKINFNEKSVPFILPFQSLLSWGCVAGAPATSAQNVVSSSAALAAGAILKQNSIFNENIIRPHSFIQGAYTQVPIRDYTYFPKRKDYKFLHIKDYSLQVIITTSVNTDGTETDVENLLNNIQGFYASFDASVDNIALPDILTQVTISGTLGKND